MVIDPTADFIENYFMRRYNHYVWHNQPILGPVINWSFVFATGDYSYLLAAGGTP
jgi:hypothetical protein